MDKRKSEILPTNQITQGLKREVTIIDKKRASNIVASNTPILGLQREKTIFDKKNLSSISPPHNVEGGGGPAFTS